MDVRLCGSMELWVWGFVGVVEQMSGAVGVGLCGCGGKGVWGCSGGTLWVWVKFSLALNILKLAYVKNSHYLKHAQTPPPPSHTGYPFH